MSRSVLIFLHHSDGKFARLYGVGDHVPENNVGTVFAQFRHLKITSLYKNADYIYTSTPSHTLAPDV